MKRRDFLRASAVGGAAAVGASVWTRRAHAVPFGEIPSDKSSSMLPENLRAQSVLECFLYGGLIPWETFYCIPGRGQVDGTWAYTNYSHMIKAAEGCGYEVDGSNPFTYWQNDSSGQEIFFGPYMKRLLDRPDVLKRLRIVINRHNLAPHEAAIPLVATGRTLGNPTMAGLSTHINRYFVDRDTANAHPAPFSYAFATGSNFIPNDNVLSLVAQGVHPGNARPLLVKVDSAARLKALLKRPVVGTTDERQQYDELLSVYFNQYQQRLRLGGSADQVRAAKFQELLQASVTQTKVDIIQAMFEKEGLDLFSPMGSSVDAAEPYSTSCLRVAGQTAQEPTFGVAPQVGVAGNIPAMSLRLASHLLTHPTMPARHATVVDVGVQQADGGGGYDTHNDGPWRQASNWDNFLKCLLERIKGPEDSAATAVGKLDLDKTMIVINSEFGRAPGRQNAGGLGRNHWPQGFAQMYIGGPIGEAQSGFYGHIDENALATTFTTPAENRIAALLALGIYPFDAAAYSGSDAQGQTQEGPAARSIIQRVLGHNV